MFGIMNMIIELLEATLWIADRHLFGIMERVISKCNELLWIADRHLFGIIGLGLYCICQVVVDCGQASVWYNLNTEGNPLERVVDCGQAFVWYNPIDCLTLRTLLWIADRHLFGIIHPV